MGVDRSRVTVSLKTPHGAAAPPAMTSFGAVSILKALERKLEGFVC
jgi:hypothetical protein